MALIVHTANGAIQGEHLPQGGSAVFRGIPYAAPPIGNLRWTPPQAPASWIGMRDCRRFGPVPIQQPVTTSTLFPLEPERQSEDCLYLNVWTASTDGRRPVVFWLYPGAFQAGSGSAPFYDGANWARSGAVMVTLNYRLSRLGFLPLKELSDESGEGVSGNYGLLDQIAALEWVRDNIAAFGGDPDCVTLFGVSSGASSASLLMASPSARGLFHRVIAESGGSFGPVGETTGVGDRWQSLAAAERSGSDWATSLGEPRLRDLRALSADRIREASRLNPTDTDGLFDACRPVIDGKRLIAGSREVFEAGRQADVPLLIGSACNEGLGTGFARDLAAFLGQARRKHGDDFDQFLSLYPATTDEQAVASALRANGHSLFTWQNWVWANLHSVKGHNVYYYRFAKAPPVPAGQLANGASADGPGAYHGASIFYSFDRFELRDDWPWSPRDRALSDALVEAWINFARTGRPISRVFPDWPKFDPLRPSVMMIGEEVRLGEIPERQYLDFWDQHYQR